MAFFQCKYAFLLQIWLFTSIEEKHFIWPSQCKYSFSNEMMTFYINKRRRKTPYTAFSIQIRLFICLSEGVGCRQYVLNFKHFWIRSKGGGGMEFFNNFWNSKYSELSEGGGSSLIGNFSLIFSFLFSDASPELSTVHSQLVDLFFYLFI